MRIVLILVPISLLTLLGACANPVPVQEAPTASCPSCQVSQTPRSAIAVSNPGPCNDFPVGYRVNRPETSAYVGPVEKVELVSASQDPRAFTNCAR